MNTDEFVLSLTHKSGRQADHLLQHLYDIQQRCGHIPATAIALLAKELKLSEVHIQGVVDFYTFLHRGTATQFRVHFSDNITDQMQGNRALMQQLRDLLEIEPTTDQADALVSINTTSCTGMCDQGPALLINGRAIPRLNPERIASIAELIQSERALESWPQELFLVEDQVERKDILLSDTLEKSRVLKSLIEQGDRAVLRAIEASALRGRGGAGFDTGSKWRLCQQTAARQRYVVCNADEGEPGTFKDRVLLNQYADRVFDGMTVAARIVDADKGFLYLRAEYAFLRNKLEATLQARRDVQLLGGNILGVAEFDFDIEIRMGAGAYICGEESALIESLEGKRGIPRARPPFPVTSGYRDQPTLVNNVETFMAAALVTIHGTDWFHAAGMGESSGSKILSISGDCARPGVYEYPFGVSIEQILDDCGAKDTQAVQVSGAAGFTISPDEFQRRIAFEDVASGGSFMIFNSQRDLLEAVRNFTRFFKHESCGFCTPCRVGNSLLSDLMDKLHNGHATPYDLDEMRNIGQLMRRTSHCGLGKTAANPILDTLKKFPQIYAQRLRKSSYEPAFDLNAALEEARELTGRNDPAAYIRHET